MTRRREERGPRDHDRNPRHRPRGGNHKFGHPRRERDNFHKRRQIFNNQRRQFNRPFRRKEKLSQERLNDDLDKYFEKKGGESLNDYLDNVTLYNYYSYDDLDFVKNLSIEECKEFISKLDLSNYSITICKKRDKNE